MKDDDKEEEGELGFRDWLRFVIGRDGGNQGRENL